MEKNRVGYLGGCWDLFHVGHLNCIKRAKEYCDYLIVEVTPDRLVYAQKNKLPIIGEKDRLAIIRAIRYVDEANISDEERDEGAFKRYGFNVLFVSEEHKGKEYYKELEEKMAQLGVDVVFLPYTENISSTIIREKLGKQHIVE